MEHGGSIALAGEGERVLITGSVRSIDGPPVAGAILVNVLSDGETDVDGSDVGPPTFQMLECAPE